MRFTFSLAFFVALPALTGVLLLTSSLCEFLAPLTGLPNSTDNLPIALLCIALSALTIEGILTRRTSRQ